MPKTHQLKTLEWSFDAIMSGTKRFEIRNNDREFQVGDFLHLRRFHDSEFGDAYYTGEETYVRILYLTSFEQKSGFVVLGISDPI